MALASLALLLALGGYAMLCAVRPFTPCRKCTGTGVRPTRRDKIKACRRCRGQRYRLRLGRRLYNTGRDIHHAGTQRPRRYDTDEESASWP